MKLLAAVLLSAAALAAAEARGPQRGKQLVEEALQALGGRAFTEVKNRVESGRAYSFYREQLTGLARAKIYTAYLDGADGTKLLVRERQTFGKDEDSVILFLENEGLQLTYRGAKPLPDERFQRYRESTLRNFLYILRKRLGEPGLIFDARGPEIWLNMPVEVVDIIDSQNLTTTVYLHARTKLPVRQVYERRHQEDGYVIKESVIFSKYRDVGGGVQWPFNILAERDGEKIYEIFAESVAIDQPLSPESFTAPGNMKRLKPD